MIAPELDILASSLSSLYHPPTNKKCRNPITCARVLNSPFQDKTYLIWNLPKFQRPLMGPSIRQHQDGDPKVPNHKALIQHGSKREGGKQEPYQRSVEPHGHILEHLPPNKGGKEHVKRKSQRQEHRHGHHLQQTSNSSATTNNKESHPEKKKGTRFHHRERTWRGWYGSCHPCLLIATPKNQHPNGKKEETQKGTLFPSRTKGCDRSMQEERADPSKNHQELTHNTWRAWILIFLRSQPHLCCALREGKEKGGSVWEEETRGGRGIKRRAARIYGGKQAASEGGGRGGGFGNGRFRLSCLGFAWSLTSNSSALLAPSAGL